MTLSLPQSIWELQSIFTTRMELKLHWEYWNCIALHRNIFLLLLNTHKHTHSLATKNLPPIPTTYTAVSPTRQFFLCALHQHKWRSNMFKRTEAAAKTQVFTPLTTIPSGLLSPSPTVFSIPSLPPFLWQCASNREMLDRRVNRFDRLPMYCVANSLPELYALNTSFSCSNWLQLIFGSPLRTSKH